MTASQTIVSIKFLHENNIQYTFLIALRELVFVLFRSNGVTESNELLSQGHSEHTMVRLYPSLHLYYTGESEWQEEAIRKLVCVCGYRNESMYSLVSNKHIVRENDSLCVEDMWKKTESNVCRTKFLTISRISSNLLKCWCAIKTHSDFYGKALSLSLNKLLIEQNIYDWKRYYVPVSISGIFLDRIDYYRS